MRTRIRTMWDRIMILVKRVILIVILLVAIKIGYVFVKALLTLPPEARKDFNNVRDALGRQFRGFQTVLAASSQRSSVALMEERQNVLREKQRLDQDADVLHIESKYVQAMENEKNSYYAGKALPGDEIIVAVYRKGGTSTIDAELFVEGAPGPWPQRVAAGAAYKLDAVRHNRYRLVAQDGAGNWSHEFIVEDYPGGSHRIELEVP